MLLPRDESPPDNGSHNFHHHIQSQDSMYNIHASQSNMYNSANSTSAHHIPADYSSDPENQKLPQSAKINGFGPHNTRSSFSMFTNTTRPRHNPNQSVASNGNTYRDNYNGFYPPPNGDAFPSQLTSPTQSHMQPFDIRANYDFANGHNHLTNGVHKSSNFNSIDLYNQPSASTIQQFSNKPLPPQQPQHQPSHLNGYPPQNQSFNNGLHLSSQTPFGPHIPSNGQTPANMMNANGVPPGLAQANMMLNGIVPSLQNGLQEEISTIFVVGFPDDMQEREFQNMFTFSPGFEAATLKIPNKEYTAYGGTATGPNGLRSAGYNMYGGSNDPYNLVTVNQGGVVVDGREGTMTSWPTTAIDDPTGMTTAHYSAGGLGLPPRKQIIGFAKFRSKEEALAAKEVLQGRRVDIEKGAVLKAEMAKKNLHTKRGVGPVPGGVPLPGQNMGIGGPNSLNILSMNGLAPSDYLGGEAISPRERDISALGTLGLSSRMNQWREQDPIMSHMGNPIQREEDEWRRERDVNTLGSTNLAARGPRERAEDEEHRRRREKDMRLRADNSTAFDAFHSVPAQQAPRQPGMNGMLSVAGPQQLEQSSNGNSPMMPNGIAHYIPLGTQSTQDESIGPWDNARHTATAPSTHSSSPPAPFTAPDNPRSSSSPEREPSFQRPQRQPLHSNSDSRASSVAGSQSAGSTGHPCSVPDGAVINGINNLAVSTSSGNTSPQLPSPESGSSASMRNSIDQNPPISTLYVGNLPTSPSPPGLPPDVLEDALRELFQTQPGYRRLAFKQKTTGPMCFVEFEDVQCATKTLNDLYGNTLKGMVKGGGIRLSYSKNPLGVRTPTSATGSGLAQQQQQSIHTPLSGIEDRNARQGPVPSAPYMTSPPPPRFYAGSPPNNGFLASSTQLSSASEAFMPRHPSAYAFGGAASFAPFGMSHSTTSDQHGDHLRPAFFSSLPTT